MELMLSHNTCILVIFLFNRTNYKGLPIIREIYLTLTTLYQAEYYGYINSDILISPSLFPVLTQLSNQYNNHYLTDGVSFNYILFIP